ncbi:hypothetical protein [Gallaecimonas xiamenensis]|uniref:Uncharacterized protein n=1 Tax=Gallaecimonas xiamenensis 3-C-1 TaxID=745411 RepID=K2JR60_9GAMM|nr:hypothetical protein [Gallaecimonas xiamenensis]EKE77833.1 hypothetical protein B3C1_00195 [Gallaecimonas xiamenensis 3-C-1]
MKAMLLALALMATSGEVPRVDDFVGAPYSKLKAAFLAAGWQLQLDGDGINADYPEISCGSGYDALCSVGFSKGQAYQAVTLEHGSNGWVVTGEY